MRDLLRVHVAVDGGVGRGAERLEEKRHLFLLDQLADLLDRARRAVAVIQRDEVDLAPLDAAHLVHHREIGRDGLADGAVNRSRARIGVGVADLDGRVGDAGHVGGLRRPGKQRRRCSGGQQFLDVHGSIPPFG